MISGTTCFHISAESFLLYLSLVNFPSLYFTSVIFERVSFSFCLEILRDPRKSSNRIPSSQVSNSLIGWISSNAMRYVIRISLQIGFNVMALSVCVKTICFADMLLYLQSLETYWWIWLSLVASFLAFRLVSWRVLTAGVLEKIMTSAELEPATPSTYQETNWPNSVW